MIRISAVIITKNEQSTIDKCLKSLVDVVDEVIVFDSFSTDETEAICKSFQSVRFFQHKFDNFSNQKNRGNAEAANDYILSLDADEVLSAELQKAIIGIKESPDFDVYSFSRLNYISDRPIKHGLWYPDRKERLFNRNKAHWKGDGVHETLNYKGALKKNINANILHYSYESIHAFKEKAKIYSDLWAENKFNKKKSVGSLSPSLHCVWTWLRGFILKQAFLDGTTGMLLLNAQARDTYMKYKKLYRLNTNGRIHKS